MNPGGPPTRPALRVGIFILLSAAFTAMVFVTPRFSRNFSQLLPENYKAIATQAIRRGDYGRAIDVTTRRLQTAYYDFEAHEMRAEAYAGMNRPADAVAEIASAMSKLPAARARNLPAAGFDEARSLALLTTYLWKAARFADAAEMARAALDAGSPVDDIRTILNEGISTTTYPARLAAAKAALHAGDRSTLDKILGNLGNAPLEIRSEVALLWSRWALDADGDTTTAMALLETAVSAAPSTSPVLSASLARLMAANGDTTRAAELRASISPPGARLIPLTSFEPSPGATITETRLVMPRNGTTRASINTGVFRVGGLFIQAQGTSALGSFPIVIIRASGAEVARLYLDGPQPAFFDLPLWPDGAPKMVELEFEFINDLYEPVTKADRNAIIEQLMLH